MHFGVRDWNLSVGASDGNLARGLNIMTYTSMFHFRTAADPTPVEGILQRLQGIPWNTIVFEAFSKYYRQRHV